MASEHIKFLKEIDAQIAELPAIPNCVDLSLSSFNLPPNDHSSSGDRTCTSTAFTEYTYEEIIVDVNNGSDENGTVYKTLHKAVNECSKKDIIRLLPGEYGPADIRIKHSKMELQIKGTFKSYLTSISFSGNISVDFIGIQIGTQKFKSNNGVFKFKDNRFRHNNTITLEDDNELYFDNAFFEKHTQIISKDGKQTLIFNNCRFETSLPLVLVESGDVQISLIDCIFNHPVCHLPGDGNVLITHKNCIFNSEMNLGNKVRIIAENEDNYYDILYVDVNKYNGISIHEKTKTVFLENVRDVKTFSATLPKSKNGHQLVFATTSAVNLQLKNCELEQIHIKHSLTLLCFDNVWIPISRS